MIYRIFSLIIKELQEQFSTVRGILVLLVPVLVQTLIFPFVATQDVTNCRVAIYCEDSGGHATELMQRIAATPYITKLERVYSRSELTERLDTQQCMVAVSIPSDFSRCLQNGQQAQLQIVADGLRSTSSQIATGYINSIAAGLQGGQTTATGGIQLRHLYNSVLNYRWFILTCLFGMLGMITSMNISCMALAKEREAGTYEQLCVTPLSPLELLLGKTVPATLVLMGQCSVILAVSVLGYDLPVHGSLAALFLAIVVYSLSLTGIGFLISSFCRTQQQAFIGMFCFLLPTVLLSGFMSPVDNLPEILQYITLVNPLYYIFIVARGVFMKGYGLQEVLPYIGIFVLIGTVTMSMAYLVLRLRRS